MSANNTPLSGAALTPLQRVSLNSALTNIVLDSDIENSSLVIKTGTANSLYIDKNSNVGINTNHPTAQLEVASANGACLRLRYGTSTSAYSNLFTTSTGDLSITSNSGAVNINSAVNISGNLNLSGSLTLSGGGSLAATLGVIDSSSSGMAIASKALVVDSNRSIVNINNLGLTTLTVGSAVINAGDASKLSGLVSGTAVASKALILDSLGSISGITTLSAQSLSGVLQTSTQPNITLLGTLSSLNVGGATIISSANDAVSTTNGGALTISGGMAVAKNVYIGGNLYVNGATTSVNSTTINISDNTLLLNASPSAPNDSGILVERYQTNNDSSSGNTITDTPSLTSTVSAATSLTITLTTGSNVNDYYKGWWVLIGTQTRKVTSYNGTNRIITVETGFTIIPTVNSTVQLYNRSFAGIIWNEGIKTFQSIYTAYDSSSALSIIDEAPFRASKLTSPELSITGTTDSSSTSTGSLITTGGMGIAKSLWVGTGIHGTIMTSSQPQITSIGSLQSLTISNSTPTNSASIILNSDTTGGIGINGSTFATNPSTFYISYNGSNRLLIDPNGNVAIGTSTFGYKLNVGGSLNANSISIGGSSLATNLISGSIIAGIATASKVLSVDSNLDLSGINTLTVSTSLKIGSLSFSSTELGYLTGVSAGTAITGKVLIPDGNKSLSGLSSLVLSNTSPSGVVSSTYSSDTQSFVSGVQGSGTSISANSYYWYYNGAYRMFMNTSGNIAIGISTVDASTFNYKLNVNGSLNASNYYLNGSLVNLDIIQGPIPGTASASRALVVDSSRNITNINTLGATSITIGSNQISSTEAGYITGLTTGVATAGKALIVNGSKDISGIGSLSVDSLTVAGQPVLTSTSGSFAYIQNITEGTASASKALVTDSNKDISGIRHLGILDSTATGGAVLNIASNTNTLTIGARGSSNSSGANLAYVSYAGSDVLLLNTAGNIAIGSTGVSTYKLNVGGSINATSFYLDGTPLTLDNLTYLSGAVAGTATPSKALVLDSSSNVSGINSLSSDKLVASTSLKIGSNTITYEAAYLAGSAQGTAANGKVLVLDINGSVSGINNLGASTLTLGSSVITSTTAGYLAGVTTAGSATAGKVLTTDSNNSVSGINNIAAQSLTLNGAALSPSLFDAINGVTAGQISPNKAMIFDSTSSLYFGSSQISFANSMFTLTTNQSSDTNYTVFQRWINSVSTNVIADISVSNLAFRFGTYSNHALRLMTNNSTKVYIDTLGNVGIGDISPEYRLDVAGTVRGSQLSNYGQSSSTLTTSSTIGSYGLLLGTASATTGIQNQSAIAFINTNASYATATPSAVIALERIEGGSSNSNLVFFTKSSSSESGAIGERMRITSSGNVGIGTTTPSYQLDLGNTGTGINTNAVRFDTSNSASPAVGAMIASPTTITPSTAIRNTIIAMTSTNQLIVAPSAAITSTTFLLYANDPTTTAYTAIPLTGAALTNFTPTTGLTCTIMSIWISPTNTIWVGGTLTKTGYSKVFLFSGTTAGISASYLHSTVSSSTTANLGVSGISGTSNTNIVAIVQVSSTTANVYYTVNGTSFVLTGSGAAAAYSNVFYLSGINRYIITTTGAGLYYCSPPVSTISLSACSTPSSTASISSVCYNAKVESAFAFAASLIWTSADGITWSLKNSSSGNGPIINDTLNGGVIILRPSSMVYYTSASSSVSYPFSQVFATALGVNTVIQIDTVYRVFGFTGSSAYQVQYITLNTPSYYTKYGQIGYLTHGGNYGYQWYYGSNDNMLNKQLMSIDPVLGLVVGNSDTTSNNAILFGGTIGDTPTASLKNYHTGIVERIYANTEDSELLIFKGNDPADRIRYRAPNHIFQIGEEMLNTLADDTPILCLANNGMVGIGIDSPSYKLDFGATSNTQIISLYSDASGFYGFGASGSTLHYQTTSHHSWYTASEAGSLGTQLMRLTSAGRLGIGASNPQAPLHVIYPTTTGTSWLSIQRSEYDTTYVETQINQSSGDAVIGTRTNNSFALMTNNTRRLTIDTSGNVGVGNNTPAYKLDVNGTISGTTAYFDGLRVNTTSSASGYTSYLIGAVRIEGGATYTHTTNYGYLNAGSSPAGRVTSNFGSISVGLYVSAGRILCSDEINALSDKRIKTNIELLDSNFVKTFMTNANPVKFKYKKNTETDKYSYGFIAQDFVKQNYIDLYNLDPCEDAEELIEEDGFVNPQGYAFNVCYQSIIPMLTLSAKDTYNEVDALKLKVASLEERLAKLESLLDQ